MLGHHDTGVSNLSDFGRVKKAITNHLACKIIDSPTSPKDNDQLAGDFRAGNTILITDLMFRVGTQSGAHGIQMGLSDMGWDNVMVFKIHEATADRPLEKFLETLGKRLRITWRMTSRTMGRLRSTCGCPCSSSTAQSHPIQ